MSKARTYGAAARYVPNARADERYSKKVYQRGRDFVDTQDERQERKENRQLRRMKEKAAANSERGKHG